MVRWLLFLVSLFILGGCSSSNSTDEIVAQVGRETLSISTVQKALGESATAEMQVLYVKEWVDRSLLAAAAKKNNLDKNAEFKEQVNAITLSLLASRFVSYSVGDMYGISLDSQSIESYYTNNKSAYIRDIDCIKVAALFVSSEKKAWRLRRTLTQASFMASFKAQETQDSTLFDIDTISSVPLSSYTKVLGDYLWGLDNMALSLPRKINDTFAIVMVLEKSEAGSVASLKEVYDEVVLDATVAEYQKQVQKIKDSLRESSDYFYNDSLLTAYVTSGDSL